MIGLGAILRSAGRRFLPSSRTGRGLFVLLLTLGIFLRVAGIDWGIPRRDNASSYYHDEGHMLGLVEMDWGTFRSSFGFFELARPVMFFRVVGRPLLALGRVVGLDDKQTRIFELVALRTIPAAFSILGLLAVYAVGRAVSGTTTGLWALAFLAVMPGHWYYANILKGEILVATMFTVLLLVAFRLADSGGWATYLAAGALLGFGVSLKPTLLAAMPVLFLAHVLRAVRLRAVKALFQPRVLVAVLVGLVVFFLWYPYPYLNWPLFQKEIQVEILGPRASFLQFRGDVRPQVYAQIWQAYSSADRPFLDMVFGRFLAAALPLAAAFAAIAGFLRLLWQGDSRLLLSVIIAALFFHSLSFAPPLDDRYVLPASPFVALFTAVAASAAWLPSRRSPAAQIAGAILGGLLFFGTAAVTAKTFPSFALSDQREEAVRWISEQVSPGTEVGQLTLLSRWAIPLERPRVVPVALVTGGGSERRLADHLRPEYVLLQRDPWNYVHTFRYELDGIRSQMAKLLQSYELVKTFGHEPRLWGTRLPRHLGVPVIDVYRRVR